MNTKICACGSSFISRDNRQMFCSRKCVANSQRATERTIECKNCKVKSKTFDKNKIFCDSSCATIYNNARRGAVANKTKIKLSLAMKRAYDSGKLKRNSPEKAAQYAIIGTRGKFKDPNSIMELSKRTKSKICLRLFKKCFVCLYDKTICDIHHINGRKVPDPHGHWNLSYLCPNCHREAHDGLLATELQPSIFKVHGDSWKEFYYG